MSSTGRFIVFEGGEGCGKSTQAKILAAVIGADLTREPGGTSLGESIRELVLHRDAKLSSRAELLLMAAARAQHVQERIVPALQSGKHVVCDRFSGSTLAYQGYGRGLPIEDIVVTNEIATEGLQPDLVVLLDLPAELASSRRGVVSDRIEASGALFHQRVVEGFRLMATADPTRWAVVDGSRSIDEVAELVRRVVHEHLDLATGVK
jgi:dTMP kinase